MDLQRLLRTLWRILIGKNSADGITSVFTKIDKQLDVLQSDLTSGAESSIGVSSPSYMYLTKRIE